jgi:hypothetical protein
MCCMDGWKDGCVEEREVGKVVDGWIDKLRK